MACTSHARALRRSASLVGAQPGVSIHYTALSPPFGPPCSDGVQRTAARALPALSRGRACDAQTTPGTIARQAEAVAVRRELAALVEELSRRAAAQRRSDAAAEEATRAAHEAAEARVR